MNEEGSQPVPIEFTDAECRRLRKENARLRQILTKHNSRSHPGKLAADLPSKPPKYCLGRTGRNRRRRESRHFEGFSAGEKMSTRDGGRVARK